MLKQNDVYCGTFTSCGLLWFLGHLQLATLDWYVPKSSWLFSFPESWIGNAKWEGRLYLGNELHHFVCKSELCTHMTPPATPTLPLLLEHTQGKLDPHCSFHLQDVLSYRSSSCPTTASVTQPTPPTQGHAGAIPSPHNSPSEVRHSLCHPPGSFNGVWLSIISTPLPTCSAEMDMSGRPRSECGTLDMG